MGTMCRSEGIVDINIGQTGKFFGKPFIAKMLKLDARKVINKR